MQIYRFFYIIQKQKIADLRQNFRREKQEIIKEARKTQNSQPT